MPLFHHACWFVGGHESDWLCKMFIKDERWTCEYRFRYYDDPLTDGAFNNDTKRRFAFAATDASEGEKQRMVNAIETAAAEIAQRLSSKVEKVLFDCMDNDPKFFFELASQSWAHVKIEGDKNAT